MNDRPFIGVGVLLWRDGHLLLGQRKTGQGEPVWQFPGGHLDAGETVLECAAREVFEETGLEIAHAGHAGYTDELFAVGDRHYLTLYVTAACLSGEPKVMEPEKCRCWQWFPYDELPEPLFQPIINLMKQVPDLSTLQVFPDTQAGAQK